MLRIFEMLKNTLRTLVLGVFDIMPQPYSERKIDLGKFVTNYWDVLYWGREPLQKAWAANAQDLFPYKPNVIEKRRDVSVIGFGGDFDEAYGSRLAKLEERLDRRGWDFILIVNGTPLRNGANFQYHMSASLFKINRNYDKTANPNPRGLQNYSSGP